VETFPAFCSSRPGLCPNTCQRRWAVGSITEVKGHAVIKRQGQQLDATPSMPVLRRTKS
jgi:hypothetical protein